jgi:hypothetical protein
LFELAVIIKTNETQYKEEGVVQKMIEILVILVVALAVLIVFYRQAIEQYNILQIESTQISELPKLLSERTPIVIRSIGEPKLFKPETLKSNARLLSFPLEPSMNLSSYLANPKPIVKLSPKSAQVLANETGLQVWAEHMWFSKFFSNSWWEIVHSLKSEAWIGEKGLRKTTAISTIIYPTSGCLEVTLLTEHQEHCLPKTWRGRFPEQFSVQDTPLVGEIKYITVKVRPGTMLCVPTHWFISVKACEESKGKPLLWSWIEIHNPISRLASSMDRTIQP